MTPHHGDEGIKRHANPSGRMTACRTLTILRSRLPLSFIRVPYSYNIETSPMAILPLLNYYILRVPLVAMQKLNNDPSYGILSQNTICHKVPGSPTGSSTTQKTILYHKYYSSILAYCKSFRKCRLLLGANLVYRPCKNRQT